MNTNQRNGVAADDRCGVTDTRGGRLYRCLKKRGHELAPGDEEHVADADEYLAPVDYRQLFEMAKPVLAWCAHNEWKVGKAIADEARRALIRSYMSAGPGLAKARPSEPPVSAITARR